VVALGVLLTLIFSLQIAPVFAVSITVNTTTDVVNSTDGLCSIREAIVAANTDTASGVPVGECAAGGGTDTISIPAGTYLLSVNFNASTRLPIITENVDFSGAGINSTFIQGAVAKGGSGRRVLYVNAALTVNFSNLTVENGGTGSLGTGGNIRLDQDVISTFSGVRLRNGTANEGGGLWMNVRVNVTITGSSLIETNSAIGGFGSGGGVYIESGSLLVNGGTIITGNVAVNGGGLFLDDDSNVTINGYVRIDTNSATQDGGGIWIDRNSNLNADDIGLYTNSGRDGDAVYLSGDTTAIRSCHNCCIVNNTDTAIFSQLENTIPDFGANWWGSEYGPYIAVAGVATGSGVSMGDSINGDGDVPVTIGFTSFPGDYGDQGGVPMPNSNGGVNFLTAPPALGGPAGPCLVCLEVSGMSPRTRSCTSVVWPRN